jgi:hypothetical protein
LQQTLERSSLCATDETMEKGSISRSLDRIDAAMERIEMAARNRAAAVPPSSDPATDNAASADLEQRHVALKSAVEQALGRLDTLIADQS